MLVSYLVKSKLAKLLSLPGRYPYFDRSLSLSLSDSNSEAIMLLVIKILCPYGLSCPASAGIFA